MKLILGKILLKDKIRKTSGNQRQYFPATWSREKIMMSRWKRRIRPRMKIKDILQMNVRMNRESIKVQVLYPRYLIPKINKWIRPLIIFKSCLALNKMKINQILVRRVNQSWIRILIRTNLKYMKQLQKFIRKKWLKWIPELKNYKKYNKRRNKLDL